MVCSHIWYMHVAIYFVWDMDFYSMDHIPCIYYIFLMKEEKRMKRSPIGMLDSLLKGEEVFLDGYHLVYLKKGEAEVRGEYFEVLHDGIFYIAERYNPNNKNSQPIPALVNYDISLVGFIRLCEER